MFVVHTFCSTQGITIKPLVRLLEVKMAPTHKSTLFEEIIGQVKRNEKSQYKIKKHFAKHKIALHFARNNVLT